MATYQVSPTKEQKQRLFFREIARKNGMWNTNLFEKFMLEGFPEERDTSYVAEWVKRFQSGDPVARMDKAKTKIYVKVIEGKTKYKDE